MRGAGTLKAVLIALSMPSHRAFELWLDTRAGRCSPSLTAAFDRTLVSTPSLRPPLREVCERSGRLLDGDEVLGACVRVENPSAQSAALSLVGSVEWIHIEETTAPMIVAENLLGATEGTPTRVAVAVQGAGQVAGLAFALQRGVDAIVCAAPLLEGADGRALVEALQIAKAQRLEIEAQDETPGAAADSAPALAPLIGATVTAVSPGGMADRVALDFTSLMGEAPCGSVARGGMAPPSAPSDSSLPSPSRAQAATKGACWAHRPRPSPSCSPRPCRPASSLLAPSA